LAEDELLDVLDDDGSVVGQKTRAQVHRDHDWHAIAFVWSCWEAAGSRRMLLQQRGRPGDPFAQQIDALAGGHVGAGESPVEAICRELSEEVGLSLAPEALIALGSSQMVRPGGACQKVRQHQFLYPGRIRMEQLHFSDEVDGLVEVDLSEFEDLVHGRLNGLPATARYASDAERMQPIELPRSSVLGYPDEILDTFRRSLASITEWTRTGCVNPSHFGPTVV
jgi:8-oxo-dGTP pyrophosphatase MutT (NUDIX family)